MVDSPDPHGPRSTLALDAGAGAGPRATESALDPPVAARRPYVTRVHGEELVDPYHWLRDRDDREVLAYLDAENAYTEAMTAHTAALRQDLYAEILSHVEETDRSVPHRRGDYLYSTRIEPGREYPVHLRHHAPLAKGETGEEGPDVPFLDLQRMAEGELFLRLGALAPNPSGRLVAYAVDTSGRERYRLRVLDPEAGEHLPDAVPAAACSLAWADDDTLFYVLLDAAERPCEVRRHAVGSDPADDPVVFREDDARFTVTVARSRSGELVWISSRSNRSSEVRSIPVAEPGAEPRVFLPRRERVQYSVDHHPDAFYLRTDEGAPDFRLYRVPVADGGLPAPRDRWRELLPPREGVKLEWVHVFRHHLVAGERTSGQRRLRVMALDVSAGTDRSGEDDHGLVAMPEAIHTIQPAENFDFDAACYRFSYTSPVTPPSVYDLRLAGRRLVLRKRQPVPGYDPEHYHAERIHARAPDGEQIPITLVRRRGISPEGGRPCLLYAYGSYGTTVDPSFSPNRLPLLDRGFVWAIAHVRGGGMLGEAWHQAGKLGAKRNTFDDFAAAADHLIASGSTASDRLAIAGGSAGGLLIGAVLNQRPGLARAALAQVPFVDVLNTMLDRSLPLTVTELEEWGDPRDPERFAYIRSYSPYDNVAAQEYPHLLVTAGLHDPRVQYWEPAKWVAKLRATKTDDHTLILRTHMDAGHTGASGRYEALRQTAFDYAFLLDALGVA